MRGWWGWVVGWLSRKCSPPPLHHSATPPLHHATTPPLHHLPASVKVPRPQLMPLQQVAAVEQALGQDVDDLALALDVAVALQQGRVARGGVVLVVSLGPEDEV